MERAKLEDLWASLVQQVAEAVGYCDGFAVSLRRHPEIVRADGQPPPFEAALVRLADDDDPNKDPVAICMATHDDPTIAFRGLIGAIVVTGHGGDLGDADPSLLLRVQLLLVRMRTLPRWSPEASN